jgi:hypothetical protein
MASALIYDRIADHYAPVRMADSRIAQRIHSALKGAARVVSGGAGTGSYEPPTRGVVAVEPSIAMIRRRRPDAAPAVQAAAEALPFSSRAFDAAMAVLTMQHWKSVSEGLRELRRAAQSRIVLVTMDVSVLATMWLFADYIPEAIVEHEARFPSLALLQVALPGARIETLPVPKDCADGFVAAYWQRPSAYFDARVRAASFLGDPAFEPVATRALIQLRKDLDGGIWRERHGRLLALEQHDVGLRLVRCELA